MFLWVKLLEIEMQKTKPYVSWLICKTTSLSMPNKDFELRAALEASEARGEMKENEMRQK